MTNQNKISGKIINYNSTFVGEILFDEKIINIKKTNEENSKFYSKVKDK